MNCHPAVEADGTSTGIIEQIVLTLDLAAQFVLFRNCWRDAMALEGVEKKSMSLSSFHFREGRIGLEHLLISKLLIATFSTALRSKDIRHQLSQLVVSINLALPWSESCPDSSLMTFKSRRSTAAQ